MSFKNIVIFYKHMFNQVSLGYILVICKDGATFEVANDDWKSEPSLLLREKYVLSPQDYVVRCVSLT